MADLNEFVEWSKYNPCCSVEIKVGGYDKEDVGKVDAWVYSSLLNVGQFVASADEIDLDAKYEEIMKQKKAEVEKYFEKQEVV